MLSQDDFVGMLRDMQKHVEKTIKIADELVAGLEDKELRYKLIALRQTKYMHLEAMAALQTVIQQNRNRSGNQPAPDAPSHATRG